MVIYHNSNNSSPKKFTETCSQLWKKDPFFQVLPESLHAAHRNYPSTYPLPTPQRPIQRLEWFCYWNNKRPCSYMSHLTLNFSDDKGNKNNHMVIIMWNPS